MSMFNVIKTYKNTFNNKLILHEGQRIPGYHDRNLSCMLHKMMIRYASWSAKAEADTATEICGCLLHTKLKSEDISAVTTAT